MLSLIESSPKLERWNDGFSLLAGLKLKQIGRQMLCGSWARKIRLDRTK